MIKKILIAVATILILAFVALCFTSRPQLEEDGSYKPSKLALKLATVDVSDFENVSYQKYQGNKKKILAIFTEEKNMKMQNGKLFSTGNHPIESLLPMLHLRNAGLNLK